MLVNDLSEQEINKAIEFLKKQKISNLKRFIRPLYKIDISVTKRGEGWAHVQGYTKAKPWAYPFIFLIGFFYALFAFVFVGFLGTSYKELIEECKDFFTRFPNWETHSFYLQVKEK